MSTVGFYQDAPYKITNEGREITLKLQKTSPSTANIVWTLPKGAPGCSIEELSYNGIVIVVDNVPIKLEQTPSHQVYYTGDNTVNRNLHAGDKIGTGLVVGAFYDDKKTTLVEISGLEPNVPYYVAGFAVNNVGEYHSEGVHSYSQDYKAGGEPNGPACQIVELGVQSTDLTGLTATQTYTFNITINGTEYSVNVNGTNAQTYQELIEVLNYELTTLENPFEGTTPSNTGTIYVNQDENEVYVWDGFVHNLQNSISSSTTPTSPVVGDFWVDSNDNKLYRWDGLSWVVQQAVHFKVDPTKPDCGVYWFNGSTAFRFENPVGRSVPTYVQSQDPSSSPVLPCGMFWLDTTTNAMYRWTPKQSSCSEGSLTSGEWVQVDVLVWDDDPRSISDGTYWYNTSNSSLKIRDLGLWMNIEATVLTSSTTPTNSYYVIGTIWFDPTNELLFEWNGVNWMQINNFIVWDEDPTIASSGDMYFDDSDNQLFVWDDISQDWILSNSFTESNNDPASASVIEKYSIWVNGEVIKEWDGMQWIDACVIVYDSSPTSLNDGTFWHDTTNDAWFVLSGGIWTSINYIYHSTPPSSVMPGQFWYNPTSNLLYAWNGINWIALMFQTTPVTNPVGVIWYNPTEKTLYEWNGKTWVVKPTTNVVLNENGHFLFKTGTTGSTSSIEIVDKTTPIGLFVSLSPAGRIQRPQRGTDGLLPTPTYNQLGVGTDGSSEERREMVELVLLQLGYPTVQVELTKQQLEFCVDRGLQTLRRMGSAGYERVYFFLNLRAGQQHYKLTDRTVGFHKIVDIMVIHRMTSAFLGTAEGQGVYGQLVLQHLYQMGTFDLVSYYVINEYIELMEKLFAGNIMFSWKEKQRLLSIHQNIHRDERVLIDAVIERTEQDILADRFLNNWIQQWATSEACLILAEIRGKFSTLPGAGGGVTLNSGDLRQRAEQGFQRCIQELDDYIANNNIESLGMNTQFIMG